MSSSPGRRAAREEIAGHAQLPAQEKPGRTDSAGDEAKERHRLGLERDRERRRLEGGRVAYAAGGGPHLVFAAFARAAARSVPVR